MKKILFLFLLMVSFGFFKAQNYGYLTEYSYKPNSNTCAKAEFSAAMYFFDNYSSTNKPNIKLIINVPPSLVASTFTASFDGSHSAVPVTNVFDIAITANQVILTLNPKNGYVIDGDGYGLLFSMKVVNVATSEEVTGGYYEDNVLGFPFDQNGGFTYNINGSGCFNAANDSFSNVAAGGNTPSVFTNDTSVFAMIPNTTPDGYDTSLSIVNNGGITGLAVNTTVVNGNPVPTGTFAVPANTPPGTYNVTYQICSPEGTSTCQSATATIVIPPVAKPDTFTPAATVGVNGSANIGNVLTNDNVNGQPAGGINTGNVNLSVVTPAASIGGGPVPTIDTATGNVSVPAGTPAGTYNITYQICAKNGNGPCSQATTTVTVPKPAILAVSGSQTVMAGNTGTSVIANDQYNGGTATTSTVTIGSISSTNAGVSVDPATGLVTVQSGTPAGTYTVTYTICDKINPGNNCSTTTETVTVTAAKITVCYRKPLAGIGEPTKHGITALGRAGAGQDNWPMVRNGAWTALESKTKGFVVNRVATPATTIANPVEGMMVWDTTAKCLKVYFGSTAGWSCLDNSTCGN